MFALPDWSASTWKHVVLLVVTLAWGLAVALHRLRRYGRRVSSIQEGSGRLVSAYGAYLFGAPPCDANHGTFSIYERGLGFSTGSDLHFVPWQDVTAFEWRENLLVFSFADMLFRGGLRTHSVEVPAERRPEIESLLVTRIAH